MKQICIGIEYDDPEKVKDSKKNEVFCSMTRKLRGIPLYLHPIEPRVCYEKEIKEFLGATLRLVPFEELYEKPLEFAGLTFVIPSSKLYALAEGHLRVKLANQRAGVRIGNDKDLACCEGCDLLLELLGLR